MKSLALLKSTLDHPLRQITQLLPSWKKLELQMLISYKKRPPQPIRVISYQLIIGSNDPIFEMELFPEEITQTHSAYSLIIN